MVQQNYERHRLMPVDLFARSQNAVLEASSYAEFRERLSRSNCSACALSGHRTNIVVDRGNYSSKVVIVGEAPGRHEDEQAKAFVGRAGKLLDGLLLSLGFDTNQESLVLNIVKCRPPQNRPPTAAEATACGPYWQKQISLISPKVILLLGATALKHVAPSKASESMGSQVGHFFEMENFPGIQFMTLYHPAYILRDPRKKPLMLEHLTRFKFFWDEIKNSKKTATGTY